MNKIFEEIIQRDQKNQEENLKKLKTKEITPNKFIELQEENHKNISKELYLALNKKPCQK